MDHLPPLIQTILSPIILLYNQLADFELFNNSGLDYILVPILFVTTFIVGYILKYFIIKRAKNAIPERVVSVTNPVLDKIKGLVNFNTLFIVAIYISTGHLNMSKGLQLFFDVVIFGALILAIFRFLSGLIDISAEYRDNRTEENEQHILSFMKLIGKVTVATILSLWYLSLLDVNVTSLMAGLGIAGITIAFALQNVVADLFAAIAIYLDKPFEIGDYIKVEGNIGQIEKVGLRSTRIRALEGPLLIVSNQKLTQSNITNYKKMEQRRISQMVGVSADTPVKVLRELPGKFRQILESIDNVRVDDIWLKELGDFSWNFEIIFFVEKPDITVYRDIQEEVNFRILELLEEMDIEIPYPIQELILTGKGTKSIPLKQAGNSELEIVN